MKGWKEYILFLYFLGFYSTSSFGFCHPKKRHQSPFVVSHQETKSLVRATKISGGDEADKADGTGTATIPNEIFNLVKSIIGAGVLSLPAGIAAFGNAPSVLLSSSMLIAIMGAISAYTFLLLARICSLTGATSYADAWDKTRGKKTSWIIAASSALDCFAGNLTYSMVLADTFKALLATVGHRASRSSVLLVLTTFVLLPLCLVQNLSALAPFSLIGILGMIYTSLAIGFRYFQGAYSVTGRFLSDLSPHMKPSFGSSGAMGVFSPRSLILVSMLSTAYIAHFNAPKFYKELKNNTLQRFNTVVTSSFGISIVFYIAVSSMAFLTFGSSTAGMVLNNYSTNDMLISASRFAVAVSLVFSYPLLFTGTRDGILDLFKLPETKRSKSLLNRVSYGILGIITLLATKVTDLTFVASMSGALLGTSLIFIYPTLMFRAATKNDSTKKWERRLCSLIASMGIAIGGVGAFQSL